jgi:membrane protein implicated in regulation of membrane protease activity
MTPRQTESEDAAGLGRLLKETADSLGVLIGDHVKLARIELLTDVRIYAGALGGIFVAALLLLTGYLFAWQAAASLIAGWWGAPAALGLVAGFHLIVGAIGLGAVSRRLRRTKVLRETILEAQRSVRALAHPAALARPIEGGAP